MNRFFVWRMSSHEIFRVYGSRNYHLPEISDERCIWRGDDIKEARHVAKAANNRKTAQLRLEIPNE